MANTFASITSKAENSDPIAGSPGFGLPFNNFVE